MQFLQMKFQRHGLGWQLENIKDLKGLKKENLRDNMSTLELVLKYACRSYNNRIN